MKIGELDSVDKQILLESHLVSRELIVGQDSKAVAISPNEVVSVMMNEEDHLRIQVIESGFNLSDVWKIINTLDDELSEKLENLAARESGIDQEILSGGKGLAERGL